MIATTIQMPTKRSSPSFMRVFYSEARRKLSLFEMSTACALGIPCAL